MSFVAQRVTKDMDPSRPGPGPNPLSLVAQRVSKDRGLPPPPSPLQANSKRT